MKLYLRPALVLLLLFSALLGIAYPLLVTGIGQLAFSAQARGSLLERDGKPIGSMLLGQGFAEARYFHGRPSAAGSSGYDASASSGSNYGASSAALRTRMVDELARLQAENPQQPVPSDLLTASGSGLDPHLSPAAAEFQIERVAKARGVEPKVLRQLVAGQVEGRWLGVFGEPRVNVLKLNLALDRLGPPP